MAQGDGVRQIRNAPYRWTFPIYATTTWVIDSGAASLDSEYSADGAGFSDCASEATEIGSTGIYHLDLTAAEMTGDEVVVQVKSTGNIVVVKLFEFEPALDSGVAQGGAGSSITLRAAASQTADWYTGGVIEIVRGTGIGQVRSIVSYAANNEIATVDRSWQTNPDSSSVYIIHGSAIGVRCNEFMQTSSNLQRISDDSTAADNLELMYQGAFVSGSVDDASPTVGDFDGDGALSAVDDFYNGMLMVITSDGNGLKGIARRISNYTGASFNFEFTVDWPAIPSNGDTFVIYGHSG